MRMLVVAAALVCLCGPATARAAHEWGSAPAIAGGPPVAVDDNLTTKVNTQGTAFVLDNDTDPDGDGLIVTGNTDPPHGTVVCDQFGQCDYTPDSAYLGSDSFDYTISDGNGGTDVGTVHVDVVANSPPVAADDTLTTKMNTQGAAFVLDNDTDANDDTLTVIGNTDPPHGTATCHTSGSCTYTPDAGYLGSDSFDYTVSDGTAVDTGTVAVTVAANSAPVAADDALTTKQNTAKSAFVLGNDTDPDFDALGVTGNTDPPHGTATCDSSGSCLYTPDAGYLGPDSFDYTVSDGTAADTGTVNVSVVANSPPVAADDALTTKKNAAKSVFVLSNDSDADEDALTVTGNTDPPHGTATCDPSGSCTYTPDAGYLGSDSFDYTVSDGTAADTGTVDVTVDVNSAPVAGDDTLTTKLNTQGTAFVLGNDTDANDDALTVTGNTDPPHGTATCDTSGSCTYTPDAGYLGPDAFDYSVSDGEATVTGTVNVTVEAPCAPAVCIDNGTVLLAVRPEGDLNSSDGTASLAGPGDVGLEFVPTGNDATSPGCLCEGWGVADAGSAVSGYANVSVDGVQGMTLENFTHTGSTAVSVVNIQNTFRVTQNYHPAAQTPNLYDATVTIENISGHALSDVRYRRVMDWDIEPTAFDEFVTIDGGNASELLFDSDNGFETANPLGPRSDRGHTGNFTDAGPADHGALFDFGLGSLAAGASTTFHVFYGAAATETAALTAVNAVGAEVFSLGQPSTPAGPTLGTPNTFVFAFAGVGGAAIFSPNAVDDNLGTAANAAGSVNVLANDSDPNGDTLTVTTPAPAAAHGTVACAATGLCTYTPGAGYVGADSFDYAISDGHGGTDTATVHVTVSAVNHAPAASDLSVATDQDTAAGVTLAATDADGDALTYAVAAGPTHGTLTGSGASRTYTPAAGFSGTDSFTYTAGDGKAASNTATVSITVRHVNHAPTASAGTVTTDQDTAATMALAASDPDGDVLTYTIVSGPDHGTLSGSGVSRTYTPATGYSGADSFTFKASDGAVDSNIATVTIAVRHVNRAPTASAGSITTDENTAAAVSLAATDPDGDALTYTIVGSPAHGTLGGTGSSRTYTPAAGYSGPDSFTFKVSDGTRDSAPATVSITVRAALTPPPTPTPTPAPKPAPQQKLVAGAVKGKVLVQLTRGGPFVPVTATTEFRFGVIFDTTSGTLRITVAKDRKGGKSTLDVTGGKFVATQDRTLLTTLTLTGGDFGACGKRLLAQTPPPKKRSIRRLWGNGKGRFRTKGRYSAATVRGTHWLTDDRCDGTLTYVKRGTVSVLDFPRRRTVTVKQGHRYLARP
jgi:Bacterial Ig domain